QQVCFRRAAGDVTDWDYLLLRSRQFRTGAMRRGESGNYLWDVVWQLRYRHHPGTGAVQLRYFDPEDYQDSGEPPPPVPGRILQRVQPPAVHQSELRPGRHL